MNCTDRRNHSTLRRRSAFTCVCAALSLWVTALAADDASDPLRDRHTLSYQMENDVLLGTDNYYTNGARLLWKHSYYRANQSGFIGAWPMAVFRALDANLEENPDAAGAVFRGVALGQNMYSPRNISRSDVSYGDRPYGGWSYLGLLVGHSSPERIQTLELDLGALGPAAGTRETQTFVHRSLTSSPTPEGWGTQDYNELGVRLNYRTEARLATLGDVVQLGGLGDVSLGNVFTNASAGFTLRFGWIDPERNYASGDPTPPNIAAGAMSREREAYFFLQASGTAVAYNALIEGASGNPSTYSARQSDLASGVAYASLTTALGRTNGVASLAAYDALILHPETYNSIEEYLLYAAGISGAQFNGVDYLIYNALFNGGQTLTEFDRLLVVNSLLTDAPATRPLEQFFAYSMLTREPGDPLPAETKLAAYLLLIEGSAVTDPLVQLAIYRTLFDKSEGRKSYVARKVPFYGTARLGFAADLAGFSAHVAIGVRSAEFRQRSDLPDYHRWAEFRLGFTF